VSDRQYGQAVTVGHSLIGDDDIEIVGCQKALSLFDATCFPSLMVVQTEVGGQNTAHTRFVVD
jgi:hypothetical protein